MSVSTRPRLAALGGVAGCLFLAVATAPIFRRGGVSELGPAGHAIYRGTGWLFLAVPVVATVVGLCLPRWWPYLVLAAGLPVVSQVLPLSLQLHYPFAVAVVGSAAYPLGLVGVLACAQGLARHRPGLGALVAGLAISAHLFAAVLAGDGWPWSTQGVLAWHAVLVSAGFAGLVPAVLAYRLGDPDAVRDGGRAAWSWPRLRLLLSATLAMCVAVPLSFLTTDRLAVLLGVTASSLLRRGYAESAVLGAITLVTVTVLAAAAGVWSLGGALTVATVQVGVVAPLVLALYALDFRSPARLMAALGGVVLGAALAASRWRFPLSGGLTVVVATVLFVAYAATGGHPEKLAMQRSTVPAELILVLSMATVVAVAGTTATVLVPRGALPAVLGPLAAMLATGGQQTVQATYLHNGEPVSSVLNPVSHLPTSGVLLLAAGAATGGLGFAQLIATRRAERRHTEQIRQEAAEAERSRLARPIHDGVLQVLALVQRQGSELGPGGSQLAALAGEQEVALRSLLTGDAGGRADADDDLRVPLTALAALGVEVATPAQPVVLTAVTVAELTAAVRAAVDNVRRHAGPGARAWVLVEDEQDGVRVTVRDDGTGFPPGRLDEAAAAGRLGVAQSMRGRIADRGGSTTIHSRPGEGTEVEFWVPRRTGGRRTTP